MNEPIMDFYKAPNISQYETLNLLSLSEHCAALEESVYRIIRFLPKEDQQTVEAYIQARNDLEVETFKAALRWGKQHYR